MLRRVGVISSHEPREEVNHVFSGALCEPADQPGTESRVHTTGDDAQISAANPD